MPVYLIRAGDTSNVKIVWTTDVTDRLRVIQAGCWERLYLLRTWDGGRSEEAAIHRHFQHLRIDREWFTFDPVMLEFEIERLPVPEGAPTKSRGNPAEISKTPVDIIVAHFGGQSALARAIGTSQGTIWGWLESGFVPFQRIPQVILAAAKLSPPVNLEPNDFFSIRSEAA